MATLPKHTVPDHLPPPPPLPHQMIALLKQALKVTNRSLFSDALATLSNDTNQYQRNEVRQSSDGL